MIDKKNVLITGCNGQLGRSMQDLSGLFPCFEYFFTDKDELDITDADAVKAYVLEHKIDVIVNCAAYTAVDKAESEPELCEVLNHHAARYLAEAVQLREGIMIQISTDYVFDGTGNVPYTEDMLTNPQSVYGRTKLAGEKAVQEVCEKSIIIRTAWLYSPYGKNFVKTMCNLAKREEQKTIGVVFDQIGTPTYAFDLAQAIMLILDCGYIKPGIYHYTNEGVTSWYDFAVTIMRDLESEAYYYVHPLHTAEYPTPAKRPHYSVLDKTRIKDVYGIEIKHWEESLYECLDIIRLNEEKEKSN